MDPFQIQIGIRLGFLSFKFATTLFNQDKDASSEFFTYLLL